MKKNSNLNKRQILFFKADPELFAQGLIGRKIIYHVSEDSEEDLELAEQQDMI